MHFNRSVLLFPIAAVLLLSTASFQPAIAQTAPTLGTAQSFGVVGSAAVTNTGPTVVNGDLGVSPGTAVTGFPPGLVNGTIHAADAVAAQARSDANTAYNSLAGQPCNTILTGQDLGGLTLTTGVYCFAATAQLTGTLTLDAQGNAGAVFIFKIGSTLTTASTASIVLVNGASACNVFFQVGSSATLGTGTQFLGNIFALASVTLTTNANLTGRAIGLNGAVTLDSNVITVPTCSVAPTTGFVQVCKVAGQGVAVGTNFAFSVAGTPVNVAAGAAPGGSCSAPMTVPAGAVVISETVPAGTAVTGISTSPNPGLLVSSNLGAGTATVTVNAGGQTIVTFTDAVVPPPPSGFVQVCKVAGAGLAVGTNFSFNVAGTLQTVAAGGAPGGTCGTPISTPPGNVVVSEAIPAGTVLAGVSTSPNPGLLVSSNLATGTATVTVLAGGQTIVTFIDAATPVVPTNGFIQVCKVAGAGVAVGTNFAFNVAGTPQTVAAGLAPGGTCGTPISVPAGSAVITETIPAGTVLAGVSTMPTGLLVSSDLAAGTATVTVNAGGQTIVTFIDTAAPVVPTNGFLQVCKVAGAGVPAGTNFSFNVAGTPQTIAAGVAPGGTCGAPVTVPAGSAVVTETIPGGTVVTGVSTLPSAGLLVSSNLATGTATVTVNAGGQTIVTFIDAAAPPPPTGFVQVCKVAGAGIAVGTNFSFNVAGTLQIVAAGAAPGGTCGAPVSVAPGNVIVTETVPVGVLVAGVSTSPNPALLVSSTLGTGTATVTVVAGGQTIVTFIDAVIPVVPINGFIQVCKVAGAGIGVGTNFAFNVAGTPQTIAAGLAPGGTCGTPISVAAGPAVITETIPAGTVLAGVSTLPNGLLLSSNLAIGTVTVMVNAGGQTIVTFLDTAVPVVPTNGFLQVCKVAGAGIPAGTNFSFNVAGTPQTIPAGAVPGGTCGAPVTVAAGNAVVTETIPLGTMLTGVSTLPSAGLLVSSNLATGTATVTVTAGGQTIVTFIDAAIPMAPANGFVQVCKVAGAGVPVGTNFVFNVAGTVQAVPAGAAPLGICGAPVSVPPGVTLVSETIPAGTVLAGVSTLPSAGLLVSSNLATGVATVTVQSGGQTIVTFIDAVIPVGPGTGFLQVCKVAGAGVAVGTNFTFNVAGTPQIVAAGAAPGGTCGAPVAVPAGNSVVTETIPAGTSLVGIGTLPSAGLLVSSSLTTGTAIVTVLAGGQTIVTFIDDIPALGLGSGNICVNTYVFDQSEELLGCCSCAVTPNGLQSMSVKGSLISNSLTPEIPNSVVIKLLATGGTATTTPGGVTACDTATPITFTNLAVADAFQVRYAANLNVGDSVINVTNTGASTASPGALAAGMRAWGTTLHALPTSPVTYGVTETPFSMSILSQAELNHLTSFCAFIRANASGFGICKGCSVGGLGATTQR